MTWQQSSDGFIEGDVVRWTEAIWPPNRNRSRKQRRPWGKQEVTAQITAMDDEFVSLKIMKAEIKENLIAAELKAYKVGDIIKKKRSTLLRGTPERLLWSEEDVRKALLYQPNPS